MRVVIESVHLDEKKGCWLIDKREYPEDGEQGLGSDVIIRHKVPVSTVSYRAAEYGITNLNVIVDIIICEPYIDPSWWEGDDHLFAAGNIEEARRLFIQKIAEVKLKYRISTRGEKHPLFAMKSRSRIEAGDAAIKALNVMLIRHRNGAQELDPHMVRSLQWMEQAMAAMATKEPVFIEEGGK